MRIKPCWRKEITYGCRYPSKNNCKAHRGNGCGQLDSRCLKTVDGKCVNHQQTMQCFAGFKDVWRNDCDAFKGRTCSLVKKECVDNKDKTVVGKKVDRPCWVERQTHACSYPSENSCEALRLPNCKQTKQNCLKAVNGTCVVMGRTYRCVDGVNDSWESNCHDLEQKALQGVCERVTNNDSDNETRSIEGFDYAAHHSKTNIFKCAHPSKNNCAAFRALGCVEKFRSCKKSVSNTCVVWEKVLDCSEKAKRSTTIASPLKCLDGNCRGEDDINDGNIGEAAAQLSMLKGLGGQIQDGNPQNPSIFKGESRTCKFSPLSFNNCCRMTGWGEVLGLADCSAEESQLAKLRQKKCCVPIGTYCHKWAPMNAWCRERRNSYCCFKGKLQRILQVEGRKQLGIGWGGASNPNCQGLSPADLQRIDFSKLNLQEVYGDVLASYQNHNQGDVVNRLKEQILGSVAGGNYAKGKVTYGS